MAADSCRRASCKRILIHPARAYGADTVTTLLDPAERRSQFVVPYIGSEGHKAVKHLGSRVTPQRRQNLNRDVIALAHIGQHMLYRICCLRGSRNVHSPPHRKNVNAGLAGPQHSVMIERAHQPLFPGHHSVRRKHVAYDVIVPEERA